MDHFRSRFRAGNQMIGVIVKMASSSLIELGGLLGLDLVVVDTEHGPGDAYLLEHHLMAAASVGVPAIVRVPANEGAAIQSALDLGATGVIVPHVSDAAGARKAVQFAHYPPLGARGVALTTRAARHGTIGMSEHLARSRDRTVVIVQIEDQQGVDEAASIATIPGVDGVWIGPNDLAASIGMDPADPALTMAIASVSEKVRTADTILLDMCSSAEDAHRGERLGASVHLFTAHGLFASACRAIMEAVRGTPLIQAEPSNPA